MSHVSVGFHGPHQHHVMQAGEALKFVAVPGPAVFGNAKAPEAQPFRFENQVLGGKVAVRASPCGVDMEVKNACHVRRLYRRLHQQSIGGCQLTGRMTVNFGLGNSRMTGNELQKAREVVATWPFTGPTGLNPPMKCNDSHGVGIGRRGPVWRPAGGEFPAARKKAFSRVLLAA